MNDLELLLARMLQPDYANSFGASPQGFAFGDLNPMLPQSPFAFGSGAGSPYRPMTNFAPPPATGLTGINIPFIGDLGPWMSGMISRATGVPTMLGGAGPFSPVGLLSSQQYFQNMQRASGVGQTMSPETKYAMSDAIFNLSKVAYGGDAGFFKVDMKNNGLLSSYEQDIQGARNDADRQRIDAQYREKAAAAMQQKADARTAQLQGFQQKARGATDAELQRLIATTADEVGYTKDNPASLSATERQARFKSDLERSKQAEAYSAIMDKNLEREKAKEITPEERAALDHVTTEKFKLTSWIGARRNEEGAASKTRAEADAGRMGEFVVKAMADPNLFPIVSALANGLADSPMMGDAINAVPGLSQMVLGQRIMQGIPGIAGFHSETGNMGDAAWGLAGVIDQSLRLPSGAINYEFTHGLGAGQIGDMITEMLRRGTLPRELGDMARAIDEQGVTSVKDEITAGGVQARNAEVIREKISGMTSVVQSLEEIFGRGKSMEKLMEALDGMTGGALSQLTVAEVKNMTETVLRVADITNISADQVATIAAMGGNAARQRGLNPILGVQSTLFGLGASQASMDTRGGDTYFGAKTKEQIAEELGLQNLRGVTSRLGRGTAGAMSAIASLASSSGLYQMNDDGSFKLDVNKNKIALNTSESTAVENMRALIAQKGIADSPEARRLMDIFTRKEKGLGTEADDALLSDPKAVASLVSRATGMTEATVGTLIANPTDVALGQYARNYNPLGMKAAQGTETMNRAFRTAAVTLNYSKDFVGKYGAITPAMQARIKQAVYDSEGGSPEEINKAVAQALTGSGVDPRLAAGMASEVTSVLNAGMTAQGVTGGTREWHEKYSRTTAEHDARNQAVADKKRDFDATLKDSGIGQGTAMSRAIADFMSKDSKGGKPSLSDSMKKIFGGVDKGLVDSALNSLNLEGLEEERALGEQLRKLDPKDPEYAKKANGITARIQAVHEANSKITEDANRVFGAVNVEAEKYNERKTEASKDQGGILFEIKEILDQRLEPGGNDDSRPDGAPGKKEPRKMELAGTITVVGPQTPDKDSREGSASLMAWFT